MKKVFVAIGFVILLMLIIGLNILYPLKYKTEINYYSKKYGINKNLIASVICVESRFDKKAVSRKGAMGLMQLMPNTAKSFYEGDEFDKEMLLNEKINMDIGVKYLKYLFDKYNDEITVLACYNAGETVVNIWKGNDKCLKKAQIKYKETLNYVNKVQKCKKIYKIRLNLI